MATVREALSKIEEPFPRLPQQGKIWRSNGVETIGQSTYPYGTRVVTRQGHARRRSSSTSASERE